MTGILGRGTTQGILPIEKTPGFTVTKTPAESPRYLDTLLEDVVRCWCNSRRTQIWEGPSMERSLWIEAKWWLFVVHFRMGRFRGLEFFFDCDGGMVGWWISYMFLLIFCLRYPTINGLVVSSVQVFFCKHVIRQTSSYRFVVRQEATWRGLL